MIKEKEKYFVEPVKPVLAMHPKKFALWLFIVSVVMIFAAMTSAYIVKQSDGDWLVFELPEIFWYNNLVIVASSVTMIFAYLAAKKDEIKRLQVWLSLSAVLALGFLFIQFQGWGQLVEMNVYFVGNAAGSFVYVLSGLHGLHLISGLVFLLVVLFKSFKLKVHSKNLDSLEMCATYWHFLGGLWLYLFIFLYFNN